MHIFISQRGRLAAFDITILFNIHVLFEICLLYQEMIIWICSALRALLHKVKQNRLHWVCDLAENHRFDHEKNQHYTRNKPALERTKPTDPVLLVYMTPSIENRNIH